jgi:hypothetical protein
MKASARKFAVAFLLASLALGCNSARSHFLTQRSVTGTYLYYCPQEDLTIPYDKLILNSDGTYILSTAGDHPVSIKTGDWQFTAAEGRRPPQVALSEEAYPVRIRHNKIELLINEESGQSYVKQN